VQPSERRQSLGGEQFVLIGANLLAKLARFAQAQRWQTGVTNMAGHSKWANIQHRKGRQDEKRGKIWTRLIREIVVSARQGGADLNMNPRLRLAVDKAKAANMPGDTIKKNIDKATGNLEGVLYEEIRYEGYGIGGAAIIVDCMTDNRVRTVAEGAACFF
jgi:YebC/PmpR family DNA-binding regulatory protein